MKRNVTGAICLLLFATAVCFANSRPGKRVSFNQNWRFRLGDVVNGKDATLNDSQWRQLNLPHDWSIEGKFSEKAPAGTGGGALPGGIGWYRKTFTVPTTSNGKLIFVEFDGVYRNSEVWINGHYLGKRPYGYSTFQYELTPHLVYGEKRNVIAVSCVVWALLWPHAQNSYQATLAIRLNQPGPVINRNIYGQFAEHLGRLIYEGIWVGEGSPIPNTRGMRNDVIAALKELRVPVMRWPGGCFADEYHWRDGIGPRDKRPRRPNSSWGGVDTNAFGTHEFLELCEMLGADPYINGNVGSGSPQEMMEWIEYMTSDADSDLANLRRRNGRDKPWKIPYFAVGNETWGCGGNMRPEYYADVYRQYATFIKSHSGNHIQKLAVGPYDENYNWTEVLMSQAAKQMDGLSLHYYTLPTGNWQKKGSATQFSENEWHATLARTLRIDDSIRKHSAIMDKYDPQKRVGLMVDEWGTWYDKEPGRDHGALYQQNTLRDAIVAAVNLNIFHKHADRVRMANIAQMINVLQAMLLTDKEKMVLTPTYHVFRMYAAHQGATLIPIDLSAPEYKMGDASVPSLSASASRDGEGRLHLSVVNLDPNRPAEITTTILGGAIRSVKGEMLSASAINAMNTFDSPNTVKPAHFSSYKLEGSQLHLIIPSKSVVVLELK